MYGDMPHASGASASGLANRAAGERREAPAPGCSADGAGGAGDVRSDE